MPGVWAMQLTVLRYHGPPLGFSVWAEDETAATMTAFVTVGKQIKDAGRDVIITPHRWPEPNVLGHMKSWVQGSLN